MKQHTRDLMTDTLNQTVDQVSEILNDIEQDHQATYETFESDLADASERAEAAENALREVLDRLDDWHRGLCDRDEIITGRMIRELTAPNRFVSVSARQAIATWKDGER